MIKFILNNKDISSGLPKGLLLLDFIRYHQHLPGTKIGCREGDCGACTVLVGEIKNGELVYRSATCCLMPLGNAAGKHIVTIEGINIDGLNLIQRSFADEGATQCGFCTPGFIVSVAGFCLNKSCGAEDGIDSVNGNICRCTGYKSIERAIAAITVKLGERQNEDPIDFGVQQKILPSYFRDIKKRLTAYNLPANGTIKNIKGTGKFLSGGTDLYVQQHDELVDTEIDFLFNRNDLKFIVQHNTQCIFGGNTTVTDIIASPVFNKYFPSLKKQLKLVSSTQIRNMATIGGNIINGSPIGDLTVFFLALDAWIVFSDGANEREIPLRKLFRGYKILDKAPEEYISKIYFQLPGDTTFFNFEKVSKRTHLDIASVNTAINIGMSGDSIAHAGLSAGGVAPVPLFLEKSSAFLRGKKPSPELIHELIEIAQKEVSPISDVRGTQVYKRLLLGQLIKAHFSIIFPGVKTSALMKI